MIAFKISLWERHFENGIGLSGYQRIGRIIRTQGTQIEIKLHSTDADDRIIEFLEILKKLETKR